MSTYLRIKGERFGYAIEKNFRASNQLGKVDAIECQRINKGGSVSNIIVPVSSIAMIETKADDDTVIPDENE